MRIKPTWIAMLAAVAVAGNLVSAATACQRCQSKCPNCQHCDDRGLLDVVDQVAGRFQASLNFSLPKFKRDAAGCDACDRPTCGCETRPSCGCEVAANCGCEITPAHRPAGLLPSMRQEAVEHVLPAPTSPALPPMAGRDAFKPSRQGLAPAQPFQPRAAQPTYDQPSYPVQRVAPPALPTPRAPQAVPLPDSEVDPFQDDAARRIRRVPVRSVQQRLPASRYDDSYDPQATNVYRIRLSDQDDVGQQIAAAQPHSSRRSEATSALHAGGQSSPNVVQASGTQLQRLPASHAKPLATSNSNPNTEANPLRGSR